MTYISTCLADGAVGLWALGESAFGQAAVDQAGNGNGVYGNTAGLTFGQTGIPGGGGNTAVRFVAASDGLVNVADVAAQHLTDTLTFEAWVKRASTGGVKVLFSSMTANSFNIQISSDVILLAKTGGANSVVQTGTFTDTTSFHHIAITKATTTNKVYLDGTDVTGTVTNQTLSTNTAGYRICDYSGGGFPFDGTVAMVAIYPTALSSGTVSTHYTLGSTAPVVTSGAINFATQNLLGNN